MLVTVAAVATGAVAVAPALVLVLVLVLVLRRSQHQQVQARGAARRVARARRAHVQQTGAYLAACAQWQPQSPQVGCCQLDSIRRQPGVFCFLPSSQSKSDSRSSSSRSKSSSYCSRCSCSSSSLTLLGGVGVYSCRRKGISGLGWEGGFRQSLSTWRRPDVSAVQQRQHWSAKSNLKTCVVLFIFYIFIRDGH